MNKKINIHRVKGFVLNKFDNDEERNKIIELLSTESLDKYYDELCTILATGKLNNKVNNPMKVKIRCMEIFKLYFIGHMSEAEIGRKLKIGRVTIYHNIMQSVSMLSKYIESQTKKITYDSKLSNINLDGRCANILDKNGINTVGDLLYFIIKNNIQSFEDCRIKNMGINTANKFDKLFSGYISFASIIRIEYGSPKYSDSSPLKKYIKELKKETVAELKEKSNEILSHNVNYVFKILAKHGTRTIEEAYNRSEYFTKIISKNPVNEIIFGNFSISTIRDLDLLIKRCSEQSDDLKELICSYLEKEEYHIYLKMNSALMGVVSDTVNKLKYLGYEAKVTKKEGSIIIEAIVEEEAIWN